MIIAIDGPAGSGKSTVSRMVAQKLNLLYVDTGAMYRALTFKALRERLDLKDKETLADLAKNTKIDLVYGEDNSLVVLLDGLDVSKEIRTPDLTNNVKFIAGAAAVRAEMVKMQRRAAQSGRGAVLEGRDIGTVVFPDADKKFYLDADFRERAARRHKELLESGQSISLKDIEEDVQARDKSDMERKVGPLKRADDAIIIDTTHMSIEQTVEKILSYL
ncbi:MAG: (d)CMP kinase [Candidatus Omnitrophota bacterium]